MEPHPPQPEPSIPADLLTAVTAVEELPEIEYQSIMRFVPCAKCPGS